MRIGVTGATGFIGSSVVAELLRRGHEVTAFVRSSEDGDGHAGTVITLPRSNDLIVAESFIGLDSVIHLAGIAHRRGSDDCDYSNVNCDLTLAVAKAGLEAGIGIFVFVSTVKVHGDRTSKGKEITFNSEYAPTDPYSKSKAEAEKELLRINSRTGLSIEIVRPSLVIGEGAGGNTRLIKKICRTGIPFPVPKPPNRRTMVTLESATVSICDLAQQAPHGRVFASLLGESNCTSTESFVRAVHPTARTVPVPRRLLKAAVAVSYATTGVDLSALTNDFEAVAGRGAIDE